MLSKLATAATTRRQPRGSIVRYCRGNQTIAFDPLTDKTFGNAPFIVSALASSGPPVSFQILSGPATVTGHTVTITGPGLVTVRASQSGDANYNAASPVDRSFLGLGTYADYLSLRVRSRRVVCDSAIHVSVRGQLERSSNPSRFQSPAPASFAARAPSAIVGNPSAAGVLQVELAASNAGGTTTATLAITVSSRPSSGPVILSSSSATGRTGQPFNLQIIATDEHRADHHYERPADGIDDRPLGRANQRNFRLRYQHGGDILTVSDGNLTTSSILELTFSSDLARPVIIGPSSTTVAANQFFSYAIDAPANSSILPTPLCLHLPGHFRAGLTLDSQTGTISGRSPVITRDAGRRQTDRGAS